MKTLSFRIVQIIAVLALVTGVATWATRSSRGQSPAAKNESQQKTESPKVETLVKPTVMTTDRAPVNAAAVSPFADAIAQNSLLRNDLIWTFGSKQQHGWFLYDLMIGRTLNLKPEASTSDFASAIATWQKQKGLAPTGVLDEDSWMTFVTAWQSNRLKDKTPATPDQLLVAPPSDFYDPARLEELRQVEKTTYAAYKQMLAAAIADPTLKLEHTSPTELAATEKFLKIVSSFRSREYQEQLRRNSPNAGSAGLAVNSPHFTGRALDLYVGGDPVDTKDANRAIQVNTPAYRWLVKNAERFGFRPYFYEPWHWEYVR
ncbi:MAG TPA: D-alanyl-D-alanine carboxypeptidase family protein [Pyrinomonadaceae bacterium]|nr:D-alanyl-D-alanine carboxypeptidase family protein [Pyrinomonadaceae bacterium]